MGIVPLRCSFKRKRDSKRKRQTGNWIKRSVDSQAASNLTTNLYFAYVLAWDWGQASLRHCIGYLWKDGNSSLSLVYVETDLTVLKRHVPCWTHPYPWLNLMINVYQSRTTKNWQIVFRHENGFQLNIARRGQLDVITTAPPFGKEEDNLKAKLKLRKQSCY